MPEIGTVPLAVIWDSIPWDRIERAVFRIQTRIVKYQFIWKISFELAWMMKSSYSGLSRMMGNHHVRFLGEE